MKRPIRDDAPAGGRLPADAPAPTVTPPVVDTRSAVERAEQDGDYTLFDEIVAEYLAEVRAERRRTMNALVRTLSKPRCRRCDHLRERWHDATGCTYLVDGERCRCRVAGIPD